MCLVWDVIVASFHNVSYRILVIMSVGITSYVLVKHHIVLDQIVPKWYRSDTGEAGLLEVSDGQTDASETAKHYGKHMRSSPTLLLSACSVNGTTWKTPDLPALQGIACACHKSSLALRFGSVLKIVKSGR